MNKHPIASLRRTLAGPAACMAALLILASPARSHSAVVLVGDNFESYAVNGTPTLPGDGNANPWVFSGLSSSQAVSGASLNGEAPDEKILHLEGTASSSATRLFTRQDGAVAPGLTLTLSFKLRIDDLTGSDYSIDLLDSTLATGNVPIHIRIATNGSILALTRTTGPGVGSATNSTNPLQKKALSTNVWYEFTVAANLEAQTYNVTVKNIATDVSGSTGDLYFYQNIHSLDTLRFASTTTTNMAVNWDLDDVKVTAVPEPGTAAALLIGMATLWLGAKLRPGSPENR